MTFTTPSQFALLFVKLFTSGWPQQQLQASSRYANDWIRIHQHFRYLSIVSDKKLDESFCSGIRCHRVRDTISSPNNYPKGQFTIQECRYSVALSARNGPVMPPFVVLTLFDGQENPRLISLVKSEAWELQKMTSSKRYTGVAVFQLVLSGILYRWSGQWHATLNSLDADLQTEVSCHQPLPCMLYWSRLIYIARCL